MNFSQQIKTSKSDEYYTPRYAVEIILPYLEKFEHIWCPFDKKHSEFVKALQERGKKVTFGHIETGQDFFSYEQAPDGVDCIVSNPPFSKRQAIFEKMYSLGLPFGLIINMNGLFDSKARYELFKNNNFELLIPKGRICFFDETMEAKNKPNFQSIYVCNGILPQTIEFVDMNIEK